jgi:hypothetical protein
MMGRNLRAFISKLRLLISRTLARDSGRNAVWDCRHFLIPGLYINTGGSLWKRFAGDGITPLVKRSKGGGRGLSRLLGIASPRLFFVSHKFGVNKYQKNYRFDSIVAAADGGCVLFDYDRNIIGRTYGFGSISQEQKNLRETWAKFVPSPHFSLDEEHSLLVEEIIPGTHIYDLHNEQVDEIVQKVFSAYAELVLHAGSLNSAKAVEKIYDAVCFARLNPVFRSCLKDETTKMFLKSWPLAPSGSDNSPDNVIVGSGRLEGGKGKTLTPYFIDCFPISVSSAFSHPIGVVAAWRTNKNLLHEKFLDGYFDESLALLMLNSKVSIPIDKHLRRSLLAASAIIGFANHDLYSGINLAEKGNWLFGAYGLEETMRNRV